MGVSHQSDLAGRVAIVTGGARGIGKAVVKRLMGEGVAGVAVDIGFAEGEKNGVLSEAQWLPMCVDVRHADAVGSLVEATVQRFGRIDILVTCAGVYGSGSFETITEAEWDRVNDINLKGTYFCMQQVWPHMRQRNYGKIVCIGSTAAHTGGQLSGPHYACSKAGVHALVKWAAKQGARHNIYVNGIAPGVVDTDLIKGQPYSTASIPLGRLAQPEDIASAVLFLASGASDYVTGTILDVNGGAFIH